MDTHALETAAQRYKKADDALKAARDNLQTEAVAALRAGVKQAEVVRITEWSREYLRRLRDDANQRDAEAAARAEVEALREQVAALQAAQEVPARRGTAAATPVRPVEFDPRVRDLSPPVARDLAEVAADRADPDQLSVMRQAALAPGDGNYHRVQAALRLGLLTDADLND